MNSDIIIAAIAGGVVGLNSKIVYDWLKGRRNGTNHNSSNNNNSSKKLLPEIKSDTRLILESYKRIDTTMTALVSKSSEGNSFLKQLLDEFREQRGLLIDVLKK